MALRRKRGARPADSERGVSPQRGPTNDPNKPAHALEHLAAYGGHSFEDDQFRIGPDGELFTPDEHASSGTRKVESGTREWWQMLVHLNRQAREIALALAKAKGTVR